MENIMKKLVISAVLVAAMALPVLADGVDTEASASARFEAAMGTPVVDGVKDEAYKAAQKIPMSVKTSGDGLTSGNAWVLWDMKNIYVYFDVTDPVLSKEASKGSFYVMDAVDLGLDLSGTPGETDKINAGHYMAAAPVEKDMVFSWRGSGKHFMANLNEAKYEAVKTDNGYAVEMCIPWGKDYKPEVDAVIGVAFHINSDEDGEPGGEGNYYSGAGQERLWKTSENYDKLVLTSKKLEPETPSGKGTAADSVWISGAMAEALQKLAGSFKGIGSK